MDRDQLLESGVTFLKIEGEDIELTVRCDMLSMIGGTEAGTTPILKSCVLVGEHQKLKGVYAALVTNAKVTIQGYSKWLSKCEFGYRVQYEHLPGKWAIAHVYSRDPRVVWSGGVTGLAEMLARPDFEVPFLPGWVAEIGRQLTARNLIVPFQGFRARGSILLATDEVLDEIVKEGVKSGAMEFPAGKGAKPLDALSTIEDYVTTFSVELAKKVSDTMRPVHDPAVDAPHPLIAKLAPNLYPPQAHVVTATAQVLRKKHWTYLACNMGTGKTPMGILECHLCADMLGQKGYRAIVACPPHLVEKWAREIRKWLGSAAAIEVITDWRHFMGLRNRPYPAGPQWFVIAMTKAKLSYRRRAAAVMGRANFTYEKGGKTYRKNALQCPKCSHPITNVKNEPACLEDLGKKWLFCDRMVCRKCRKGYGATAKKCVDCHAPLVKCAEAFWQADNSLVKVSPADFGKKRMANFFDFFIRDEAHHSKGADSLDGFACGALMKMAKRVVLMTGTFLAGKCEDIRPILFKSLPHLFVPRGFGWKQELEFAEKYGRVDTIERTTTYKDGSEDRRSGRGSNKSVTQVVRPGIMPRIFADFVAEHVAFLSLHELATNLPTYSEHTFNVEMDAEQRKLYDAMKDELVGWFKSFYTSNRRLAMKLLGPMLEALITWPDDPRGWSEISVYDDLKGVRIPILTPPTYQPEGLLPKEARLLEMVGEEKRLGRKCWIYAVRDDTRDRLHQILREQGYAVAHLKSAVEPLRRERWIRDNALSCDVGLCHPELVETGLELFDPAVPEFNFPTLVWYSTGFKLNTLRQASRRVWRIGQTRQCKTNYLYYGASAQSEAIALMGKKLVSAEAIEGKFSDGGLVDESGDADLALSVAKNLANNIKTKVVQTWKPVQGLMSQQDRVKLLESKMSGFKAQIAAARAKQPQLF